MSHMTWTERAAAALRPIDDDTIDAWFEHDAAGTKMVIGALIWLIALVGALWLLLG